MPRKIQPKMNKADIDKLGRDLLAARTVAMAAVNGMADGGTSCFDHPVLLVPKTEPVLQAIRSAGFRPSDGYGFWKGYVSLYDAPGSRCQGSPRTAGADAVSKVLSERGWTASVHYAMD